MLIAAGILVVLAICIFWQTCHGSKPVDVSHPSFGLIGRGKSSLVGFGGSKTQLVRIGSSENNNKRGSPRTPRVGSSKNLIKFPNVDPDEVVLETVRS